MNDEEYEEIEWESREILFPMEDEKTRDFLSLKNEEQMQVIELGLIVREVGISQVKSLLQGKNKTEQNVLKKIHNKQVDELREKIKTEEKKYRLLQSNFTEEIQTTKTTIKEQQREIYMDRIKSYEEQTLNLKKRIEEVINQRLELQNQHYDKLQLIMEKKEKEKQELRREYESKLDEYRSKVEIVNKINNNSAKKGQQGENWIFNQLIRSFPSAEIEDHHTKGHTGDFSIKEEGRIGMLESKNYARNVNKKEVEKFYKDIETNDQINYAIMASLKSGVVNREDFSLEFVSGKPVIYLHYVKDHPENIKTAYNICQLILKNMDCFDIEKEENQHKLKTIVKTMKTNNKKLHTMVNNFQTNINSQLNDQWSQFESMIKLLNIEH